MYSLGKKGMGTCLREKDLEVLINGKLNKSVLCQPKDQHSLGCIEHTASWSRAGTVPLCFSLVRSQILCGFGCHYIKLHKTIKEGEEGYEDGEWSRGERCKI